MLLALEGWKASSSSSSNSSRGVQLLCWEAWVAMLPREPMLLLLLVL